MTSRVKLAASILGRKGGKAGTPRQDAARKQNAQKAGRPRRACLYCDGHIAAGHTDRRLDATCPGLGWRWRPRNETPAELVASLDRAIVALQRRRDAVRTAD